MGIDSLRDAVFLDRDGVLNAASVEAGVPHPPGNPEELRLLPGVPEACAELRQAGLALIVVTNQPDVARGLQTRRGADAINAALRGRLAVDDLLACFHDGDACRCRKPKPGMLLEAAGRHRIDLRRSFMVGDRWSDVRAGRAAGCRTILIDKEYSQRERCEPDWVADDLGAAARLILEARRAG